MNKETFQKELNAAMTAKGISFIEAARKLKVSQPTILRYLEGKSAPHKFGREAAIKALICV